MAEPFDTNDSSGPTDGPASEADVTRTAVHQLAQECAEAIRYEIVEGEFRFTDYWTDIDVASLAERLKPFLERAMRLGVKSG